MDAFVDYVAEIEAADANEAVAKANADETKFDWAEFGVNQFDARLYVALDDDGNEIENTQRGDF